ncbi:hypothetical protein KKC08_03805 [Patescibacteria group bacterium]|nr:hypothetical protein [Patescibacteria group bacterium]MCG2702013.1 DUF5989 family protein [Candidatus Parcubacteria bacterium]MBU4389862.1 hypothetical protein [Patescibacteria group bacterium]MBU4397265.1 hypothetical protein [Patescibacteria group bacterium]MBU4430956.1 hypothetical protein [Patescibacteria group bacterium]
MFKEVFKFIKENGKWWLIPPVIIFIIFGFLLVFVETSPISAFVYMLF